MKVGVIIPAKSPSVSKSRLKNFLSDTHREKLTSALLHHVISTVVSTSSVTECVVVSSDSALINSLSSSGVSVIKETKLSGVNAAVKLGNDYFIKKKYSCTIVLPGDLPLITSDEINLIIKLGTSSNSVIISPSESLNGTNALLSNPPAIITTKFDQDSYNSHYSESKKLNLRTIILFAPRIMCDLDTPKDLINLMMNDEFKSRYSFLSEYL